MDDLEVAAAAAYCAYAYLNYVRVLNATRSMEEVDEESDSIVENNATTETTDQSIDIDIEATLDYITNMNDDYLQTTDHQPNSPQSTSCQTTSHKDTISSTGKIRKTRRWWIKEFDETRNRETVIENNFAELLQEPSQDFEHCTNMSLHDFEYLLNKVSPMITKEDTQMRKAIPAKVRLATALRFLATGDSYKKLGSLFNVSSEAISNFVPEVCTALTKALEDEIRMPSTAEEWLEVEKGFQRRFPHAVGAIAAKYVTVDSPNRKGSEYYNYSKMFNTVLLVIVDSSYQVLFADIGGQKKFNDGGVLASSEFWNKLSSDNLNLPAPCALDELNLELPYVFLGDNAFALSPHIMKPYSGNPDANSTEGIFNENLIQSRVFAENFFGMITSNFSVLKKPFRFSPEKAKAMTMACVLLHNFLIRSGTSQKIYAPTGLIDIYDENNFLLEPGTWRTDVELNCALKPLKNNPRRPSSDAVDIRDSFAAHFSTFDF